MVLISADPFLFVFRVTTEVDNLSVYTNLRRFSPSRIHKPGKTILYEEFLPNPILGSKESTKKRVNQSDPVFERTRCPFASLYQPCLVTSTSH